MIAVLFDTETTGLVENRALPLAKLPEIIELYAVVADLDTGETKGELNLLIRPSRMPLPPKITRITGIEDADLDGKPSFREVHEAVFDIVENRAQVAIAHNASFDAEMLDIEAERLGYSLRLPRLICPVEQTICLTGSRLSLSALHQHLFGLKFAGAHRAREDVLAMLRCCVELRKRGML